MGVTSISSLRASSEPSVNALSKPFDRTAETHEQRVCDDGVSDIELFDRPNRHKLWNEPLRQAMSGGDRQAERLGALRSRFDPRKLSGPAVRILTGVDLNLSHAESMRCVDLLRVGGDEQTYANARLDEIANMALELPPTSDDVQPSFGCSLLSPLGN
jgi:hypothetical protein